MAEAATHGILSCRGRAATSSEHQTFAATLEAHGTPSIVAAESMSELRNTAAVGFYERMGARYLRDSEPSAWGTIIPVMGTDLGD